MKIQFLVTSLFVIVLESSVYGTPLHSKLCEISVGAISNHELSFKKQKVDELLRNSRLKDLDALVSDINQADEKGFHPSTVNIPSAFGLFEDVRESLNRNIAKLLVYTGNPKKPGMKIHWFLDKLDLISYRTHRGLNLLTLHQLFSANAKISEVVELEEQDSKVRLNPVSVLAESLRDSDLARGEINFLEKNGLVLIPTLGADDKSEMLGNWALANKAVLFSSDTKATAELLNKVDGGTQDKFAYWQYLMFQTFEVEKYLKDNPEFTNGFIGQPRLSKTYRALHHVLYYAWHEKDLIAFTPDAQFVWLKRLVNRAAKNEDDRYTQLAGRIALKMIESYQAAAPGTT